MLFFLSLIPAPTPDMFPAPFCGWPSHSQARVGQPPARDPLRLPHTTSLIPCGINTTLFSVQPFPEDPVPSVSLWESP